ncbi:hypothetical protein MMPV_007091 [Pyropia vietnamensis]
MRANASFRSIMNTRAALYQSLPLALGGVEDPPPPHTVTAGAIARTLPSPALVQQMLAERLDGRALSLSVRPGSSGGGRSVETVWDQRARGRQEAAAATRSQRRRARRAAAAGTGVTSGALLPAAAPVGEGDDHAAAAVASTSATAAVLGVSPAAATSVASAASVAAAAAAAGRIAGTPPPIPVTGATPPQPPLSKQARRRAFRAAEAALPPFPPSVVASLSALWRAYAAEAMGPPPRPMKGKDTPHSAAADRWGERMARLDLHGAGVTVVAAADPGLVGITGVVVAETEGLLRVVTTPGGGRPGGRILALAKGVTVVEVAVPHAGVEPDVRVRLVMPLLKFRASERSVRKFKRKHVVLF